MSVNTKIIPTNLDSNKTTSSVVLVTKVGADALNSDYANITNIEAENISTNGLTANNINVGKMNAEIVSTELIDAVKGKFDELEADDATINKEHVTKSDITELHSQWAGVEELVGKKATIDAATITDLLSTNITCDYLKVLRSAHFFELIIDQIKAVGGSIILSPADGFELYGFSNSSASSMILWWIAKDDAHGKYNMWKAGDQIICQNFNNAHVGTNNNVSSKFCWALVTGSWSVNNRSSFWCVHKKVYDSSITNDEILVVDSDYSTTHPSLKKSDFTAVTPIHEDDGQGNPTNGIYKHNGAPSTQAEYIIDAYAFEALTTSQQANYDLYQDAYYTNVNDNDVMYISLEQYNGTENLIGTTTRIRDYCQNDCQYCYNVQISKTNCAQNSTFDFEEGDNFVMLGHQKQSGETTAEAEARQSAIYISAYESIDSGLKAPLIAQYRKINDFNLSTHRHSYFDANGATFKGQFITTDGADLSNVVKDYYKIIPNYTLLTRNPNSDIEQQTIDVKILSNVNNATTYNTIVPNGCILEIDFCRANNTTLSSIQIGAGNSCAGVSVPYTLTALHHVNITLTKIDNGAVCDAFVLNVQEIDSSQGAQGDDGISYNLADSIEICSVMINDPGTELFDEMTSSLKVNLQYKLIKVEGDYATSELWVEPTWDSSTQTTNYYGKYDVRLYVDGIGEWFLPSMIDDPDWTGPSWECPLVVNVDAGWWVNIPDARYNPYIDPSDSNYSIYHEERIMNDGSLLTLDVDNILESINPWDQYNDGYRNYQYLLENYYESFNSTADRTPTIFYVNLYNSSYSQLDSHTINVTYEPQSLYVNNKNILYSAKVSGESYTDNSVQGVRTWTQNNYSTIQQTSQNINSAVGSLRTEINTNLSTNYYTKTQTYNKSEIDQKDNNINLSVQNVRSSVQGVQDTVQGVQDNLANNYYKKTETYSKGQVDVLADSITVDVTTNVSGRLRSTGINIVDGTISLNGENTIINGNLEIKNSNNGLTLYDSNGNPKIQIMNNTIGNYENYNSNITVDSWTLDDGTQTTGTWSLKSNKRSLGTRTTNSTVTLSSISVTEQAVDANDGNITYPSGTCSMIIKFYREGSSSLETSRSITLTSQGNGRYTYSGNVNFTPQYNANYYCIFEVTNSSTLSSLLKATGAIYSVVNYTSNNMTRLGLDGFASNPAANCFMWSNSDAQILRHSNNGIKVVDSSPDGDGCGIKVLGRAQVNNNPTDTWFGYSNMSPTKILGASDFENGTVYYNGSSHNQKRYVINPNDGYSVYIVAPNVTSGDYYVVLPNSLSVPKGWHVKVMKLRPYSGNNYGLYVTSSQNMTYIQDGNWNNNTSCSINSNPTHATFYNLYNSYTNGDYSLRWRVQEDV